MRILILTRPEDASPKVLTFSLEQMLKRQNIEVDISFRIGVLSRIRRFNFQSNTLGSSFFYLKSIIKFLLGDFLFLVRLRNYDAVVISECTPISFWLNYYDIEKLKAMLRTRPVILYEVYYLGNTPYQINKLLKNGHPTIERYDWHLAVTDITEIYNKPEPPWSCIGLDLQALGLKPKHKEDFFAIVDFEQSGYEDERQLQIKALDSLGIPYISFNQHMPMNEIRRYYSMASLIFVQFPEAFGLPIAECLSYGTVVFTKKTEWLMSWRIIDKTNPENLKLPECFFVYENYELLTKQLKQLKDNYNQKTTPKNIFNTFISNYPHFYKGNDVALKDVLDRIKTNQFN